MSDTYCYLHDTLEPIPANVYRICYECGHVWTKRSLVRAYRREAKGIVNWRKRLSIRADEIYFCQGCLHDF